MVKDMDGNEQIAEFILNLNCCELPPAVQQRARLCLLDGLGALLAGTSAPVSRIAADYAAATWRGAEGTILLHGQRAQAAGAAFANACAANALDIDDDAIFTRGHPGAQLVPATLAVGEQVGASGQALLEALVVGYEVAIRAGRCWHDQHREIYQADGSWGAIASAAAAARLLGLDREQIQHALGIADYFAPNAPMMRAVDHPAMVKHAIGWGAMSGVTAAELARNGFTGVPSILGLEQYRPWVEDIGRHYWMVDWVFYKAWASCAWGHPACVAAQRLVQEHNLAVDEIAHIRVRTFDEAARLYPGCPRTTEEAQFSLSWPLACLLVDGEIGPRQVLEARLGDPRLRALAERVEVVVDPQVDALYDEMQEMDLRMYSAVELRMRDGRAFDSGIVERGADEWDESRLEGKFRWLVGHVLDARRVEGLLESLRHFAALPDVRPFVAGLE